MSSSIEKTNEKELNLTIKDLLISEVHRRIIEESIERIRICLSHLSEDEVWKRPNDNSNSIGNLILHLCGNVRQWVLSGIDDQADKRERDKEFQLHSRISKAQLISSLNQLAQELDPALKKINTEDLTKVKNVQGYSESVISILIHVTEHFSYHTGQITFYTKLLKDIDTGYYAGHDLNVTK